MTRSCHWQKQIFPSGQSACAENMKVNDISIDSRPAFVNTPSHANANVYRGFSAHCRRLRQRHDKALSQTKVPKSVHK